MAISIDLESVRFTRPGDRPRGSLAEHDARKPRFFRKRFLEKHIPRLGIYRLAGFVDFKRLPDRSLQVLTGRLPKIRSFNQQLYTTCEDKVVLSSFYDKLKMLDAINCEPFGFIPVEKT